MWRSIAVKSRLIAAATKVPNYLSPAPFLQNRFSFKYLPSSNQIPRFLSLSPEIETEDSVQHRFSHLSESVDAQVASFSSESESTKLSLSSEGLIENLVSEGENFGPENERGSKEDVIENFEPASESSEPSSASVSDTLIVNEAVLSLLQSTTDGSLESSLDNFGVMNLDEEFMVKVSETPHVLSENLIKFFRWAIRKEKLRVTTRVVDSFVISICSSSDHRKSEAYALWDLVKEFAEKDNTLLSTEVLNRLIALFSKLGKGKAAFEVFDKFEEFGHVPDSESYYFTIEALCRRSFFDWAWSVCEKMLKAETLPESDKVGKIICWFCKGSRAKDAHMVYMWAKEKNKYPPQSAVNFLISVLCREDETVKLALEMLDAFHGETRKQAIKPFSSVMRSLCRIKDLEAAKVLLFTMIEDGPPPGNAVFNFIISGYSKDGDMSDAIEMKKLMGKRGLKPDVFTYTVIISGYVNGGQMEEACKVLSEAKKKHSRLSPVTYHTLIRGYCKLEQFDKALELLSEMKEFGVQPNVDEYNKLIQSLCLKALDWEKAEKLLEKMKNDGLHLHGITRGLIRAVKELEQEVEMLEIATANNKQIPKLRPLLKNYSIELAIVLQAAATRPL